MKKEIGYLLGLVLFVGLVAYPVPSWSQQYDTGVATYGAKSPGAKRMRKQIKHRSVTGNLHQSAPAQYRKSKTRKGHQLRTRTPKKSGSSCPYKK